MGPTAWVMFLGGFLLAIIGAVKTSDGTAGGGALLVIGMLGALAGLGMLAVTGRVFPSGKR